MQPCGPPRGGLASNGYTADSPGGYTFASGFAAAVVMTFMFLIIILGSADDLAPRGVAPITAGLGLTLIHLVSIPVTNTSVNPASSSRPAIFAGGWAVSQRCLFWVAPLIGTVLAGTLDRRLGGKGGAWVAQP